MTSSLADPRADRASRRLQNALTIVIAIVALACAFSLDKTTASHVRSSGFEAWFHDKGHAFTRERLKDGGYFTHGTIFVAILIAFIHRARWRAGALLLAVTVGDGVINWFIKWCTGRLRPYRFDKSDSVLMPSDFRPFRGGWLGGFGPNLSFPSGHTMLAFATAATLVMLFPRWKWRGVFYALALVVAAERVLENAHWLSDAVAGIIVGIGGARLIVSLARRVWPEWIDAILPLDQRRDAGALNVDD